MKRLTEVPKSISGGALYPRRKEFYKKFTFKAKFGEPYELYRDAPDLDGIWLPRNCAPIVTNENEAEQVLATSVGPRGYNWDNGFQPRNSEQQRLVDESVALLMRGGVSNGHIIEAPTGFGKTWVGAAIIQKVGVRPCVITTKEDIMHGWRVVLSKCLNIDPDDIALWHGNKVPKPEHQAAVALVQSVCKGFSRYGFDIYNSFGLIMVDEVHRMGADKFSQAMWEFPALYRVGLSATPYRKDGKERVFKAHIGEVEVSTEMQTMIPKVIMVDTKWEVPIVYDWEEQRMAPLFIPWGRMMVAVKHLSKDKRRNKIIINFLRSVLSKGRNTVVFSDTVKHLQIIKDLCVEAGIPDDTDTMGWYTGLSSGVYPGTGKREQRERAKLAKICLATYKMCSEATDVPWWDTCILATPKADVVQPVGRIRREFEGKQQPLVLDLCDYGHEVTSVFSYKRLSWYESIGAEVVHM